MPELPEVETIKKGLDQYVKGHVIKGVEVINAGIFQGDPINIQGGKITEIQRVGKGLIINLDNGYSLAIHIKLTGQLIYRGKETEGIQVSKEKVGSIPNKFTHVVFQLDKDAKLYYNDQRKFGWIRCVKTDQIKDIPFFRSVGPEPFKELTLKKFEHIIQGDKTLFKRTLATGMKIKPLLMDQSKIGGIGNIYANDALFLAKINPHRRAKSLSDPEITKLYNAIFLL